jgi:hypothetical protein
MKKPLTSLALLCALFTAAHAHATIISYDVTNVSGNTWVYSYTITNNNSGGGPISAFDVVFASNLFANLELESLPLGWIGGTANPEPPPIDEEGFLIGWTLPFLGFGVDLGETLSGFSVRFDFLGTGIPGAQFFEILNPFSLRVIEVGQTVRRTAVSEPSALALALAALLAAGALAVWRRRAAAHA